MVTSSVGPYLLAPGTPWPPGPAGVVEATAPDGRPVVLRVAAPALVAALASTSHDHLLDPVDVTTGPGGELVVVTPGPRRERLDAWVRRRGTITAGEAVTLSLPVLAAVAHLARVDTVLTSVGLGDVELDERGAPVLVGGVVEDETPVPGDPVASRGALTAARSYVEAVARETAADDRGRLLVHGGVALADADLDELVERVHDLARPVALPTVAPATSGAEEAEVVWQPPPAVPARSAWAAVLPESELVDSLADWWASARTVPFRERLRTVRPRFWALGALVAASLVVGVVVLPDDAGPVGVAPESGPESWPVADAPPGEDASAVPDAARPSAPPSSHGEPGGASGRPGATEPTSPARSDAEAAVRGDDVVAATTVLLEARRECLREPSTSCFAAVDQAGSPAARDDVRVLDDPSVTAELVLPVHVESEVQRLGESVVLACRTADDEPASVLVVRTEAGWRLREVVRR
jgi:hypothetical protein